MHAKRILENLVDYAKQTKRNGQPLSKNPLIRQKLAQLAVEVDIARAIAYRVATAINNKQVPGPESPALKAFASELSQRMAQVGMDLLGLYGQLKPGSKWAPLRARSKICISPRSPVRSLPAPLRFSATSSPSAA